MPCGERRSHDGEAALPVHLPFRRRGIQAGAEQEALYLAARAAKAIGAESAVCVWKGPVDKKLPARVRAEIESEV